MLTAISLSGVLGGWQQARAGLIVLEPNLKINNSHYFVFKCNAAFGVDIVFVEQH